MRKMFGVMGSTAAIAAVLLTGSTAFAQTTTQGGQQSWGPRMGMHRGAPGVFGTVSAISGTTLTVQSKGWQQSATTTYTVDASNATVTKNGSSSSIGAIAVGDTVMVQGTVSGTSVTATAIHDGVPVGRGPRGAIGEQRGPAIQGNGEPIIGGSVTAVSGSALTVTTKTNVAYTVDASNATVIKNNATSSVSSIATGDGVIVQGTVQGTAVTASSVIDHGAVPAAAQSAQQAGPFGFFGAVGGFFHRLFGFF